MYGTTAWLKYILIAVVFEKSIQHSIVTLALFFNWAGIRSTLAVAPSVLIVLGAIVAGRLVWMLGLNVVINGYPVMLQRDNRIKLQELIDQQCIVPGPPEGRKNP